MTPSLSVVLPVFNRVRLLEHPLGSLRAAARAVPNLQWELLIVDDGSTEDVATAIEAYSDLPIRLHRQENRGLLAARLAGLRLAQYEAVFFLDGDDAVDPGKFLHQLSALGDADIVYGDVCRRTIDEAGQPAGPMRFDAPLKSCADAVEFYLGIQPAPHNPIFRRSYLETMISAPLFPPDRAYDPIAETWFYYQLCVRPARIAQCVGAWSVVGEPSGDRISRKWEKLAAASIRLMQAFYRHCPTTNASEEARRRVGVCAFATWRALPRGFPWADAFLELWRQAPPAPLPSLGGASFCRVARILGAPATGRIFKTLQRPPYRRIRTVDDTQLAMLFSS